MVASPYTLLWHPAESSVNSAFFEEFCKGGLWENIILSIHKRPIHLTQK